jgi:hypothetical protein
LPSNSSSWGGSGYGSSGGYSPSAAAGFGSAGYGTSASGYGTSASGYGTPASSAGYSTPTSGAGYATPGSGTSTLPSNSSPGAGSRPSAAPDVNVTPASYPPSSYGAG